MLRETTSQGRCELVCPSRTNERGGEGDCVKEGEGEEGERERERAGCFITAGPIDVLRTERCNGAVRAFSLLHNRRPRAGGSKCTETECAAAVSRFVWRER